MALKYWVRVNGGFWNADPDADPANDVGGVSLAVFDGVPLFPVLQGAWATLTANFGATPFTYTVPHGFTAGWSDSGAGWTTLDPAKIQPGPGASLSGGNLTFHTGGASTACQATDGHTTGNFYFEVHNDDIAEIFQNNVGAGVSRAYPGIDLGSNYFVGKYSAGDFNGAVLNKSKATGSPNPATPIPSILVSRGVVLNSNLFSYKQGDTLSFAIALIAPPPPEPVVRLALLNVPELQFTDANGLPYAAGTIDLYEPNSTTPKDSWIDANGDTLNQRPITLDAAGRCIIWGDGLYRFVLRDADGNLVYDQLSSTLVSAAMVPVVGAPTLALARDAMGITDSIQVETDRALAAEQVLSDAIAAEVTVRETNVTDLQTALTTEANNRIAADADLQTQIDALTPSMVGAQAGAAAADSSGHVRVTFGTPFTTQCDGVSLTVRNGGFGSDTTNVENVDRFGFDAWFTQAGSPIPKPGLQFYWTAVGS